MGRPRDQMVFLSSYHKSSERCQDMMHFFWANCTKVVALLLGLDHFFPMDLLFVIKQMPWRSLVLSHLFFGLLHCQIIITAMIMTTSPPATEPAIMYGILLESFSVGLDGTSVDVTDVVDVSATRVCTFEMLLLMAFEMSAIDPLTMETRLSFEMASTLEVPGGNCK